jgi:hypothetical protein
MGSIQGLGPAWIYFNTTLLLGVVDPLTKSFKNIAVLIGSESRFLMMAIIHKLIDRHGSKVHVYFSGSQELYFLPKAECRWNFFVSE